MAVTQVAAGLRPPSLRETGDPTIAWIPGLRELENSESARNVETML